MINKRLRAKLDERKRLLAEINSAILAYDPVLREKARDILLTEVFGVHTSNTPTNGHEFSDLPQLSGSVRPASLQDLMNRWPAKTQAERALLSAYHLQMILRYRQVTARQIQNNLKKLGLRLTNVTVATSQNAKIEPPRMKKTESRGKQRNQYAVTDDGVRFVENKLNGAEA